METLKRVLIAIFVLQILKVNVNAQTKGKEKDVRLMLKTVLEQNRRLVLQNNRLQQVWFGIQQMCKAVTVQTCDCNGSQVNTTGASIPHTQTNPTTFPRPTRPTPRTLPLQVHTIKSNGAGRDPSIVTISYSATPDHTTEWIGLRTNGGMWRTAGKKVQKRQKRNAGGSLQYTSTVDVVQLPSMRQMFFRLYNDDESVNIRFNISEIEKAQEQKVVAPTAGLLKVNSSYRAAVDSDLNITAIVNKNAKDFHELAFVEVFFTGLNTSSSPPAIFEIMNFNSEGLGLSMSRRTEITSNMYITLRHPYVQYGGILTVRMPYRDSMTGMVEEMYYGPFIKVYAADATEVVQNNTIGIFPLARQTIVFPPTQSMICAAMGNPRPDVSILKIANGGKTSEMQTETVILDSFMNMKVLTMSAGRPKRTEGRYICRASNGNQTIDAPTEVIVLSPATFDEAKTGVTKNASDVVVISCKAKGKPKPELSLRLYDEMGPDLIKSGMYKVWRSDPNRFTSRVTLTISPIDDPDIHTVFCQASQGGPNGAFEVSRKIDVFPGVEKENNWEVYNRVQALQVV